MNKRARSVSAALVFLLGAFDAAAVYAQSAPATLPAPAPVASEPARPNGPTGAPGWTAPEDRAKVQQLNQNMRGDEHQIGADRRDIRQDDAAAAEDRQQLHQADHQWMQDNRAYRHDLATGNMAGARAEQRDMQGDRAAMGQDMHALNHEERQMGRDRADMRAEHQDMGRDRWAREVRHDNMEDHRPN